MSERMRVAAVQTVAGGDVAENLANSAVLVEAAAGEGARLIVLPEYFGILGARATDKLAAKENDGTGPQQDFLSRMAREHHVFVVGGSVPLACADSDRVRSACLVYGPDGARVARYDKIHLFDVDLPGSREGYRESANAIAGAKTVTIDTPAGRLGLSVCYDLRFPELYRRLASDGAEIFSVPSAFTGPTGRAHWEVLLRARAIENLSFVIAAAQSGVHDNDRETYGDSLIADHWGRVLGRLPRGSGIVLARLDREDQAAIRRVFPSLTHRKLG
jgi:nitrilase